MTMLNAFRENSVWIFDNNQDDRNFYMEILSLRYKLVFFDTIADLKKAAEEASPMERPSMLIWDVLMQENNYLHELGCYKTSRLAGIPLVVVSSLEDMDAIRYCYDSGAMDFFSKPIRKAEFLVKVENVLKGRSHSFIGYDRRELYLDGVKVDNLTSKQIRLLSLFMDSPSRTVNRTDILEQVWGSTTVHPKTVDVHLYNLRRKLHDYGYFIRSEGGGRWCLLSAQLEEAR